MSTSNVYTNEVVGGAVYDDLRVPLDASKAGGSKDPDFVKVLDNGSGSQGVFAWHFDDSTEEELYFSVQFPHSYDFKAIEPHIHWMPKSTGTGTVRWGLEYTWTDIYGTFSNTSIIYAEDAGDGTAYKHQYASFGAVDSTVSIVSSMMLCRLFRDATHVNDDYSGDAVALEFDIHFGIDTVGSLGITSKWG